MPKRRPDLTEAEQRVMEVLWKTRSGTVGEVLAEFPAPKAPAFNTVQTILRILETKGYVRHQVEGRAFRYLPLVDRAAASRNALQTLVRRFFGSPDALAMNLVKSGDLDDETLAEIGRLVANAEDG
jgi:BlaI family transcriptional regulator, penicillinase repressor